jgi:glycosyltransferase involved in cell wall biosynthesis
MSPATDTMASNGFSLGIVQAAPTQFDEPFYRYLAKETKVRFKVYYYAASDASIGVDPEIGQKVGWAPAPERGYPAEFFEQRDAADFACRVVGSGHDFIVVSGYNQPHALFTALLAKWRGVPTGLRSDNVLPKVGGRARFWRLKRAVYPLFFRLYAAAHPVGRKAGEYLMQFGFSEGALFRFPYAVDHRWFAGQAAWARAHGEEVRKHWRLRADGPVVCGVMKFSEREDPLTLVRAFKTAKARIPNLNLLLIGDGPLRRQVEEAAGADLGERVALPGYQKYDMLPRAYGASDMFVHTANGSWEVSVNEALACGLPVVTSDEVGSAEELILPGKFGYTYPHRDEAQLAERMVAVLEDGPMLRRAHEHGLESLAEWDYPATAERLVNAVRFARDRRARAA